jgi:general secretion pathway protein I
MRSSEDGSVLMEALVSAAIVATMLVATYRVIGDSALRHQKVEARRYALMLARSQMAAVGTAIPLASGLAEGNDGEDIWRVAMEPCGSGANAAGVLYCVTVSVSSAQGGGPLLTLSSRRLGPLA